MIATYIELNCNHFSLTLVGTFLKIKVIFTCYNKSWTLKMKFMSPSKNINFSQQNVFFFDIKQVTLMNLVSSPSHLIVSVQCTSQNNIIQQLHRKK